MRYLLPEQNVEPNAFANRIVTLKHRLNELPMFTDDGLQSLIERHPRHALSICGMQSHQRDGWTEGLLGDLCGAEIMRAIECGQLWLNVRQIYTHQPEFTELVDQLYREMETLDPGLKTQWKDATLLISSPTAYVNFHLDIPCNLLWHIRGVKRVWIYPRDDESIVPREDMFATVSQEQTEMLSYAPAMDAAAHVSDLHPGAMYSWPQHSPHRVDNVSGLNVSLSTEHLTLQARQRIRLLQANHFLRTRLGIVANDERPHTTTAVIKRAIAAGFLGLRKLARSEAKGRASYPVTFRVDPNAPDGRVELEGSRMPPSQPVEQAILPMRPAAKTKM